MIRFLRILESRPILVYVVIAGGEKTVSRLSLRSRGLLHNTRKDLIQGITRTIYVQRNSNITPRALTMNRTYPNPLRQNWPKQRRYAVGQESGHNRDRLSPPYLCGSGAHQSTIRQHVSCRRASTCGYGFPWPGGMQGRRDVLHCHTVQNLRVIPMVVRHKQLRTRIKQILN